METKLLALRSAYSNGYLVMTETKKAFQGVLNDQHYQMLLHINEHKHHKVSEVESAVLIIRALDLRCSRGEHGFKNQTSSLNRPF